VDSETDLKTILVAGFGNRVYDNLSEPFVGLNRLEDDYSFNDLVKVNSFALSEYEPFFRFFDSYSGGLETFGLAHYRCFLDVNDVDVNTVYVTSYDFQGTLYKQFTDSHRNLEEHLLFACSDFTRLTGFDAADHVKNSDVFYYRNLFIAPIGFAEEWYLLSKKIAYNLVKKYGVVGDRWIGYILERLFSVFVVFKANVSLCVVSAIFTENK